MTKTATENPQRSAEALPKHVCREIWARITERLSDGEPLMTNGDCIEAAEDIEKNREGSWVETKA